MVRPTGRPFSIRCGPSLLGRVIDGLGEPIDGKGPLDRTARRAGVVAGRARARPIRCSAAASPSRCRSACAPSTRSLTVGEGQRIGLFAGPGLGKSTLLGQIARNSDAEVIVIGLVGERGREVRDFLETQLDEESRRRAVCVCATSDAPPLLRLKTRAGGHRGRRVLPRAGQARAPARRLADARGARAARGRPRRRRAAGAPGLSTVGVRHAAAAARALGPVGQGIDHRRLRRADRRATTPTIRSPRRCAPSSTGTSCCRASWRRATSGRRSIVVRSALARDGRARRRRAPPRRRARCARCSPPTSGSATWCCSAPIARAPTRPPTTRWRALRRRRGLLAPAARRAHLVRRQPPRADRALFDDEQN